MTVVPKVIEDLEASIAFSPTAKQIQFHGISEI